MDYVDDKKFRLQATRFLITYRSHLDKMVFLVWLELKLAKNIITFCRIAHETGDKDINYDHSHVVLTVKNKIETRNCRFFDYNDIHPHIKTLKNDKALTDAKHYIAKEDPDNKDLLRTFVENIQCCNSLNEALKIHCKKPAEALGIQCIYNNKPTSYLTRFNYQPDRPWQISLLRETENTPDTRKLIWYVDKTGNNGKTALAKWLFINYPNKWYITKDMGTSRDASTIISHAIKNGWECHGLIIDLPRTSENHDRMYTYIEEIKDGFITSVKYQGNTIAFDNPWVIIFANYEPRIHNLSKDRWDIRCIDNGEVCEWAPENDNSPKTTPTCNIFNCCKNN